MKMHSPNTRPRIRLLPPMHALKVLVSNLNGRHSPIQTAANDHEVDAIERHALNVPHSQTDTVSYLQIGALSGRRVIFVHGTPGNAKGWVDYLLDVPDGRQHIAVDRLGYGSSTPGQAVVSLRRQAQAIAPLLARQDKRKPILVGHSLGAPVITQVALDYPGKVGGLLLLAGAFDPDLEEVNCLQPLGQLKPISRLLPRTIDTANRELLGLKRGLIELADRLPALSVPIIAVTGDMDPLVPRANIDYLESRIDSVHFEKIVLVDRDHFIPWHSKPEIDEALERLIGRVRKTEDQFIPDPEKRV